MPQGARQDKSGQRAFLYIVAVKCGQDRQADGTCESCGLGDGRRDPDVAEEHPGKAGEKVAAGKVRKDKAQREARSASYNQCLNRYSACQSSCDGLRDSSSRNSCRSGCASCSR